MEHLTVPFYTIVAFFTVLPIVIAAIGFFSKSISSEEKLLSDH